MPHARKLEHEILTFLAGGACSGDELFSQPFSSDPRFTKVLLDLERRGLISLLRSTRTADRTVIFADLTERGRQVVGMRT